MHRLPSILVPKKRMDSKSRRGSKSAAAKPSPKLERSIALRNVDYEPSTSSSSGDGSTSRTGRSLELDSKWSRSLELDGSKSIRIDGSGGEIDDVFRCLARLGVSMEDFEIPVAKLEASNSSSSSDTPPPVKDSLRIEADDSENSKIRIESKSHIDCDIGGIVSCQKAAVCGIVSRLGDSVRSNNVISNETEPSILIPCNDGGGGIKGARPPILAPPPFRSLPVPDDACSTWDIVNSFGPKDDGELGFTLRTLRGVQNDAGEDEEVENDVGTRIMNGVLSASCSFTSNSNDDDCSSTTTEPMSVVSPNGKYMRIITGWQKGQPLGSGSFGTVYEGIADGGFFFAVKEVSLLEQGEEGRQRIYQLEQEIDLLRQFEHENIVQYYGTEKDGSKLYIFLELVSQGSLLKLYKKYKLQDSQVSAYTRQILHGLKYLHNQNVIHRDIKCANILVDTTGLVKLADFGLAKATKLNNVKSCKGTPFWMAPEVVNPRSGGYGLSADIWSLGCTVLEMLTSQFPYSTLENPMQALYKIGQGEPPHVPNTLSKDARNFIHKCLQVDPNCRPNASQLLDHPFVKRPLTSSSGSASPRYIGRRL
ncbi:PREDICTED: mitogen-activated protein kinase kinase kinase 1-like [Ipomoea nil]|uniref:mitogen-activated protein kinase kinase kinase 1-like n=1 Tax=Ipomoea nil TaxID=35883 RepID=UPI000900A0B9|nr:PREDICTED: mitogen-activated protein kinase kinase kinase 1-like [Ipomoea nil]